VLVMSVLAHGLLLSIFAEQRTLVGAMIFIGLTSLAVMVFMGMANVLMQTRTPDHLRGRAMSVHTMVMMGFMPLGQMLLGALGTVIGIDRAFLAGGLVVVLVSTFALIRASALRDAIAAVSPRVVARSG
jgi:hypothetical protein